MATSETPILQRSVKDPNLPLDIRLGFIKKVYGIMIVMLLISFGIASPFVFKKQQSLDFMEEHPWIPIFAVVFLLAHQIVNLAMMFEVCCGGGACRRAYLKMFVTMPFNYIFVMSYAAVIGVLLGFICAEYTAESVVFVFVMTSANMAALTIYAVTTNQDFTGCGMYLFAFVFGLMCFDVVADLFPHGPMVHKVYAAAVAIFSSFIIIYHTQLIFGHVALGFDGSSASRIEITVDMYCFAAYQLYVDFINLFVRLLELLGKRDRKD